MADQRTNKELPPLPPMLREYNPPSDGDRAQLYTSDQMYAYGQECMEWGRLRARTAGVAAAPVALTKEAIADMVRQHLTSTYHCTRVWDAWNVGTMSQEDFEPADESPMADEIADAILAAAGVGEVPRADD